MNAHFAPPLPAWLRRLIASKPTVAPQPRCSCGRYCAKEHKPDITEKLVADMSAAGLYVPAHFTARAGKGP
ncbi:hypothetical protein ACFOOL_15015 [Devosia honganensis]|uniref:Uncharacterized protein n=1 Tax=Devosia honganensis TaxID=1610527 RepID=A0ABV7X3C5_9HYPH